MNKRERQIKKLEKERRTQMIKGTSDECLYCDIHLESDDKKITHLVPKSRGGNGELNNLVVVCEVCCDEKGSLVHEEYLAYRGYLQSLVGMSDFELKRKESGYQRLLDKGRLSILDRHMIHHKLVGVRKIRKEKVYLKIHT